MNSQDEPWIPPASAVPEAIAWWAGPTPDAPPLVDVAGNAVSFGQLQERIEAFGTRFGDFGIGRKDRVVLALPDGVAAAMAGLACLRAAVAVPVNPAQSRAEIAPVLEAVQPRAVIVAKRAETAVRAAASDAGVLVVDLAPDFGLEFRASESVATIRSVAVPADESMRSPDAGDLTMIFLTSGTTDRPRRVPVTHRNIVETCSARVRVRGLSRRDRGISSAPAYFVLGLARVIESLISGGSAIVTSAADLVRHPEAIRDLRPTWAWLVPALLETVLDAAQSNPAFAQWPLRFVRSGGAMVPPDLIARSQALWRAPAWRSPYAAAMASVSRRAPPARSPCAATGSSRGTWAIRTPPPRRSFRVAGIARAISATSTKRATPSSPAAPGR